ncbi:MAG TPA: phosphodiester glycosidase family protein [Vicinamibacterales bacterium]|nr:phosphodiester glycosidase family protein [Vicinamibacterales bacterium]
MIDSRLRRRALARGRATAILAFASLCLCLALPPALVTHDLTAQERAVRLDLPPAKTLAPGVLFYSIKATTLVTPEEPMTVCLLRLDPRQVELRSALANDEIMGTEVVSTIGERYGAIAAINAGFFLPNGDPNGVLTLGGRLVSDTRRPRGAVGILNELAGVRLMYARLKATAVLTIGSGAKAVRVAIDGVDTTRARGQLMLFTPSYHADTDTAPSGLEWVVDRPQRNPADSLRIVSGPHRNGRTPIPREGFVLSFGGTTPPALLARLKRGVRVSLAVAYDPVEGSEEPWSNAQDIVGGAGLLIRDGRDVDDWSIEAFNKGFAEGRHPRTMIGNEADGTIWLVTVDGRQPAASVGMTLVELRTLARRLDLVNALNLDGGGSTTMWVQGRVVNSPSDAAGPRKVSDALIVRSLAARTRQEKMSVR